MSHYEIEVKSLLGSRDVAELLKARMKEIDPSCVCTSTNKQLNHYFKDGDIETLYKRVREFLSIDQEEKMKNVIEKGTTFSVRTRQKDDEVLLVVKASVDSGTSANTVSRLEFEEPINLTLKELDEIILDAGFSYQAKWSREREEYAYKDVNVCIDKNAGYGFLAEFEKIVHDEALLNNAREEIGAIMSELAVEELMQDRLERMFDFYNKNWADYYGTDKTFIIE